MEAVGGHARTLLVVAVNDLLSGMEYEMARALPLITFDFRNSVRGESSGALIEAKLEDGVRLAYVRNKGKMIGSVRLDKVSLAGGIAPLNGRTVGQTVSIDRMHRDDTCSIVGGEEKTAGLVGGQTARISLEGD